jgi:hypothetical protein
VREPVLECLDIPQLMFTEEMFSFDGQFWKLDGDGRTGDLCPRLTYRANDASTAAT